MYNYVYTIHVGNLEAFLWCTVFILLFFLFGVGGILKRLSHLIQMLNEGEEKQLTQSGKKYSVLKYP